MWYDSIMVWLLCSPLHGMLSKGFMLITLTGRKSGKSYTLPVNYLRDGDVLWVTSFRRRTWWRNLQRGAPVAVILAGRELKGRGEALVDERAVAESLRGFLQKMPRYAKYYGIALDPAGQPVPEDCARAAQERVMIRIYLARR